MNESDHPMLMPHDEPQEIPAYPAVIEAYYLVGATASGKSAVSLELAERLGAEIISLDSMAVYRKLDIGTAKASPEDRARVPHHLLDVVDPDQDYSLADYLEAAHATIAEIRARGKQVLFVGGTPLYLKSLLRGVCQGPPPDWEFRKAVEEEIQAVGLDALRERLMAVDPLSAMKLHPHDQRRMIRALEVYKATGRPLSHIQTHFESGLPAERCRAFVLSWPRETLHARIEARVEQMFHSGLLDETRGVLESYSQWSRTAAQAVGYRESLEHLRGEYDLAEAIERTKAATRQFARRQETWFRGLSECRWISLTAHQTPGEIAERIASAN